MIARVIPEPRTFQDVEGVMRWASTPRFDGKSVLQLEDANQIAWRAEQPHGKTVWRKINLIIKRVRRLKDQRPRGLTEAAAITAADEERRQFGKGTIPGYIRHLERMAAAENKAAQGAGANGD